MVRTRSFSVMVLLLILVIGCVVAPELACNNSTSDQITTNETVIGKVNEVIKGTLISSGDSRHVAYIGGRGDKHFAVVDGVEGKEYDTVGAGSLVFSPNGRFVLLLGV